MSPHTFLHEVMRMLGRHGITAVPRRSAPDDDAALRAAAWLMLELGVKPDVDPGDYSEAGREIRKLMKMHATAYGGA
jgi:hypothetical protein